MPNRHAEELRREELKRKRRAAEEIAERVVGHLVHDPSGAVYYARDLREAGTMFSSFQTDCC